MLTLLCNFCVLVSMLFVGRFPTAQNCPVFLQLQTRHASRIAVTPIQVRMERNVRVERDIWGNRIADRSSCIGRSPSYSATCKKTKQKNNFFLIPY
jgi:hypothetical protein